MNDLKKTFLAGFAVLLILLAAPYYLDLIGYTVVQTEEVVEIDENQNQLNAPLSIVNPLAPVQSTPLGSFNTFQIKTPLYNVVVSNRGGGSIQSYDLADQRQFIGGYAVDGAYQNQNGASLIRNDGGCAPCVGIIDENNNSQILNDDGWQLSTLFPSVRQGDTSVSLSPGDSLQLTFVYSYSEDITIIKKTSFYGNSFVSHHNVVLESSGSSISNVFLSWDKGINPTEKNLSDELSYASASISVNKEIETVSFSPSDGTELFDGSISRTGNVDWAGIRNKYFIAALIPQKANLVHIGAVAGLLDNKPVPIYNARVISSDSELSMRIFLGPLDIDYINALDTTLDRIMNFGWFIIQPFSRGVLWLLKLLHSTGLNYGIILILFAFIVRVVTGPLTKKSFQSSQQMQAVQPQLKKLQEKYKNDSKKLNQEMMKLYRDNKVNPAGGCFPMLLQMPLLFSLFLVFRSTIEFRGAPFFGWISNLSQPDTIFNLSFHIPVYGNQVAFLPLLLGVSMFLTQKMSMANMDKKQKPMMYIMSAFFFLIFNSFPSGLNLYYLVYNILNYLQQRSLKKA